MELRSIDAWATVHHGLYTRALAVEAGWSASAWYRAIGRGLLEEIHPGVVRLHGSARTAQQCIAAGVLACGEGAVASHRSAARLWGIERPDGEPVDVTIARARRTKRLRGVTVHRPTDVGELRPVVRAAIPCTNLLRTLCDLGAVDRSGVPGAVEQAITSGAVTPIVLRALLERHSRRGRDGIGPLRRALDAWPLHDKPADSLLETAMARLLQRYDLPPAVFHATVAGFEVDFLIEHTSVVLECDGWDFHGRTKFQSERDRERDAIMTAAGFVPVRFTWRHITRRAAVTARRIETILWRWAPDVMAQHRVAS